MSKRSSRLSLLFGAAVIVAACTGGTSPSPSAAPSTAASTEPSAAASTAPSTGPTSDLLIGVQTDVGTINDKNFNQYSYAGAAEGADAIGAKAPPAFVPKDPSEYAVGLQSYVDKGYNIIVVNGFNAVPEVTKFAKANPDIWFVGVDHNACLDAEGNNDPTFACAGSANWPTLLPNYIGNNYQEDQVGYLAGIAAAKATKSNVIGAVGGITLCGPCVRYMQGYVLGAKSVNPDIKVKVAWVSTSDFVKAFADQALGKTFTEQFLTQNEGMDVVFQVAGLTGNGVIDAACAAGIAAIGVDVDQALSYPDGEPCTITSATKALQFSVAESIKAIAAGTAKGGFQLWNAANDGVGFAPLNATWVSEGKLPADTESTMKAAFDQMKAGTLTTCPAAPECGKTPAPPIGD
ncbi:MAG TPA: BMP family ABC transporter substrate-binding protein [Candidatus Limnocylindrales bacterium]|nr:BMP family ABC transporter substrate-binding protein [Candidatus Limnocylindrales bacterium]